MRKDLARNRNPNGRVPRGDHPYSGLIMGRELRAGVIGGGIVLCHEVEVTFKRPVCPSRKGTHLILRVATALLSAKSEGAQMRMWGWAKLPGFWTAARRG